MRGIRLLAATLALSAMTVGLPIPGLRLLVVDQFGRGGISAGAFAALHVVGTIVGAWLWGRWLRARTGAVALRPVTRIGLACSALLLTLTGLASSFPLLLTLRFLDGVVHVGIVMLLMGAGAHGDERRRAQQMGWLGAVMVLGVGAGLALGGMLATSEPRLPFFVAALLAGVGSQLTASALPNELKTGPESSAMQPARGVKFGAAVIGPMVLVFVERLAMGVLTVALPYAAIGSQARTIGTVLGTFVAVSVVVMPLVRRLQERLGFGATGQLASLLLAVSFAVLAIPSTLTMPLALCWAVLAGAAAGATFMCGLLAIASRADPRVRMRALGVVHAAGGVGHACGAFASGLLVAWEASVPGQPGVLAPTTVAAVLGTSTVLLGWLVFRHGLSALRLSAPLQPETARGAQPESTWPRRGA